jgi:hypothetical protein
VGDDDVLNESRDRYGADELPERRDVPLNPPLFDPSSSGPYPEEAGGDPQAVPRDAEMLPPHRGRIRRLPQSTRNEPANAGAELERRVARLEFAEGALARLRVPVHTDAEAGREILTDLDVLSLDFDNRLRLARSMLECKSGKGQSGEGDRLLWLAGLQKLLQIERAVLVRQTTTRRGKHLASRLDIQVLDVATIGLRELAHAWLPDRFAHVDGPACVAAESRADTQLKGLGHIPTDLVAFLRHQTLLEPSYRSLGALEALRRAIEHGGVLPMPTRSVLAGHALQAVAIAALQDAARLDVVPAPEVERRIELALTVGAPDDDHVLAVLGRADQLMSRLLENVHRAYNDAGAPRIDVPSHSLRQLVASPPSWVGRYVDLTQKLRANPSIAREVPQTIELAAFDGLLGDNAYQESAFDHLFTAEHRYLVAACVKVVGDIAGLHLADSLAPILDLDFSRSAPSVPDRTARRAEPATDTPSAKPARVLRAT